MSALRDSVERFFNFLPPRYWQAYRLADALQISEATLRRRCREEGIHLGREIRRRKLALGYEKLREGAKVIEAAKAAGYSRPECLTKALRRERQQA